MHARWLSFVVWALLAASLAYWSLMLMAKGPQAPAMTRPAAGDAAPADWSRLFAAAKTADAPVEATSSNYQLLGVVAPTANGRHPGEGVALIAIGGALPKPVRVGQVVDGELKLIEINRRDVGLGAGDTVTLRLSLAAGAPGGPGGPGGPGWPGAPDIGPGPGQPPQGMPGGMPPNFRMQQGGRPGPGAFQPPTEVTGALPQPTGDGGGDPTK